jgi:DNA polymerase III delta subunit
LNTDSVDFCNDALFREKNVIVVANNISDEAKVFYKNILIEVPKITDWQLQDMVYSYCKGVPTKYLDWLIKECNGDIHRLYNESVKLSIFNEVDRQSVFCGMDADGAFDDLTSNTIFNFTNAIMKHDINAVKSMYSEIKNIGVSDFGFLSVLYNNFMSVVSVQMGLNPTAEKLGMKPSQFNAVRYNCGKYTNTQLVNIVKFLSGLDFRIKSGELPTTILIDYILTSIMSF